MDRGPERQDRAGAPRREAPTPHRGGARRHGSSRLDHHYRMSAGDVLARSFAVFLRQLPLLVVLGALAHALPTWLEVKQVEGIFRAAETGSIFAVHAAGRDYQWPILISRLVLPLAFQAIVIFAVFQHLRGKPAAFAGALPRGFTKLLPAIFTAILMGLGLGIVPVLASILFVMVLGKFGFVLALAAAVAWIGMLGCAWYVAIPVTVVERSAGAGAIGRSGLLTRGSRWAVFGVALVVFGIPALVAVGLNQVKIEPTVSAFRTRVLVAGGIGAVFAGLQAVTASVMYHNLRVGKEGVDVEDLLKVFD